MPTNPLFLKASIGFSLVAAVFSICTIPFHSFLLAASSLVVALLSLSIALCIRHQLELEERTRLMDLISRHAVYTDMSFSGVSIEDARRAFAQINQHLRDTERSKGIPDLVNPDCDRCQHFDGQTYGGNRFVCGMHPYGKVDCPDFEELD